MSGELDPAGVKSLKKEVYHEIDPILEDYGFDKARCGAEVGIKEKEFSRETGFWVASKKSKPTRWFVHFVEQDGKWVAKVPEVSGSDRVGYANFANRDNVAALAVRVIPVIRQEDVWEPYEEWEWLMIIFFPEALDGSAAQLISGFEPPSTTVEHKKGEINPVAIHVYSLCQPDLSCTLSDVEITYLDATERLMEMFEGEKQNEGLFGDQMSEGNDQPDVSFYNVQNKEELRATGKALDKAYADHAEAKKVISVEQIAEETGVSKSRLETWAYTITSRRQIIFYGPPGTGKTFLAQKLARNIAGHKGVVDLIQFHSSYSYEDFMQGLRPKLQAGGELNYQMEPGRFLDFCCRAEEVDAPCVLVIDEVNRANLSQVFGELMYLLEYRDKTISLAGGEFFSVPQNVHIVGTMNTADRSIALVDFALRRRFAFIPLLAEDGFVDRVIRNYHKRNNTGFAVDGLIEKVQNINEAIGGKHYSIGPSYFLRENLEQRIESIWRYEIVPYLEEHFFEQPERVDQFRWEEVREQVLATDTSENDE